MADWIKIEDKQPEYKQNVIAVGTWWGEINDKGEDGYMGIGEWTGEHVSIDVERLAKENHILKHEVHRGMTWYEVQHLDHLQSFAQAIIAEYVCSGEPVAFLTDEGEFFTLPSSKLMRISHEQLIESIGEPGQKLFTHAKQDDLQALVDKWCKEGETLDERLTRERKDMSNEMKRHAETKKKSNALQAKLDVAVEQMASLRKWVADGEYSDDSCYPKYATSEFRQAVTKFDNALSAINKG